jgi:phosphatidylinositol 4-kinase A
MVLQMLLSRFQAARYDRRDLVLLILRLILRSAMAFREVRYVIHLYIIRFRRLVVSTHALSREPRFSFLLFGFEALKSSRMDSFCENKLREVLYAAALSWFACPPQ